MPLDLLAPVKPGDPIKADTMNELIARAKSFRGFAGGFSSSSGTATRQVTRGGSSLRWGQAVGAISAAVGWAAADRGTGQVQFYKDDGTADGDPIDIESEYRDGFIDTSVVLVDLGYVPPRVVGVGCTEVGT